MDRTQRREWRTNVFRSAELTASQKLVLLALETFADYPAGTNARPGVANLAELCGLKSRVVESALSAGKALHLIEQTSRANPKRGLAATYRLVLARTDVRVESNFNPHVHADRTDFQPAQNGFQPAQNDVSTRTRMQPTNPLTPNHNTDDELLRNGGTSPGAASFAPAAGINELAYRRAAMDRDCPTCHAAAGELCRREDGEIRRAPCITRTRIHTPAREAAQ